MGCDIHPYAELRWNNSNCSEWHEENYAFTRDDEQTMAKLFHARHYDMFALLADVRNNNGIEPLFAPRGIPSDVSAAIRAEYDHDGSDAHSASWITLRELRDHKQRFVDLGLEVYWNAWVGYLEGLLWEWTTIPEYVRVVFWFDN